MKIKELEQTYQQLHEQSLRGEISEDEFKASVESLRFEDDQGRQWKIGWYTGKWYRYDQGRWIQDEPAPQDSKAAAAVVAANGAAAGKNQDKRSATPWLVALLVLLLLLTAATLVAGWNFGWWGTSSPQPTKAVAAAASDTPLPPTEAPTEAPPLPTILAAATAAPSRTPRATATEKVPAQSPTASASPSVTPTPTSTGTSAPPAPAAASLSGQIYFPVFDPERRTFDIHTVQLESGERQVLIEQASQLALSPDGKRLAYRSWDRSQRGLHVWELADEHSWTWINFAEAARPIWSPDSENIVFPSQQQADRQWRVYRSLGLEYDLVRRHGGDIFGRVPIFLADGRIVYWECPLDKCGLYVMQSDGTDPVRLTLNEHDTAPAASPDGSQVAFMSNADGNWEIYIVDTATTGGQGGQGLRRLTNNPARDGLPTWSPDSKWLAFVTNRDGEWALWAMRPDGSSKQKLLDLGGPLEGEIAFVSSGDQHGWTWETIAWGQ